MDYKLSEQELKDLMHRTWLKAKKFYTGKTDEYFYDYFESEKKQLPIYGVMCSLNLDEIETLVILKHYDDSDFGWSKKDCEEMREESRKAVGYTKADLENYT